MPVVLLLPDASTPMGRVVEVARGASSASCPQPGAARGNAVVGLTLDLCETGALRKTTPHADLTASTTTAMMLEQLTAARGRTKKTPPPFSSIELRVTPDVTYARFVESIEALDGAGFHVVEPRVTVPPR